MVFMISHIILFIFQDVPLGRNNIKRYTNVIYLQRLRNKRTAILQKSCSILQERFGRSPEKCSVLKKVFKFSKCWKHSCIIFQAYAETY